LSIHGFQYLWKSWKGSSSDTERKLYFSFISNSSCHLSLEWIYSCSHPKQSIRDIQSILHFCCCCCCFLANNWSIYNYPPATVEILRQESRATVQSYMEFSDKTRIHAFILWVLYSLQSSVSVSHGVHIDYGNSKQTESLNSTLLTWISLPFYSSIFRKWF
jgi:hypothetical protein